MLGGIEIKIEGKWGHIRFAQMFCFFFFFFVFDCFVARNGSISAPAYYLKQTIPLVAVGMLNCRKE